MDETSAAISSGQSSAQRLCDALATMLREQARDGLPRPLTAKTLCELAGISRNALYRYHPDALQALHEAQRQRRHRPDASKRVARQLRRENDDLREQLNKLAALVDHYIAAWQEGRLLLERRDREVAELRRRVEQRVVPIRP